MSLLIYGAKGITGEQCPSVLTWHIQWLLHSNTCPPPFSLSLSDCKQSLISHLSGGWMKTDRQTVWLTDLAGSYSCLGTPCPMMTTHSYHSYTMFLGQYITSSPWKLPMGRKKNVSSISKMYSYSSYRALLFITIHPSRGTNIEKQQLWAIGLKTAMSEWFAWWKYSKSK